ncbi:TetR/AcrR family transcriptional regulator [Dyella silvatica]|uniref:TetR/AcrR family transcriptional regulator n=1 Tax=Dyella silvatica TaxID=2992128 RepID=UPI00224FC3F3|nr:TetR/AcrR family transcriptional regulator [Dyella silvatica]
MTSQPWAESTPPAARDRILQTAHDLFYRDGVRATGIDRVIAEAGVTKVTFYRHFPSKDDLVLAYLAYRHQRWIDWFIDALKRHGARGKPLAAAVVAAMSEWFASEDFRGCAFINSVIELGGALPEVHQITQRHKQTMVDALVAGLPATRHAKADALAMAVAIDGALVRAQYDEDASDALKSLTRLLASF